MRTECFDGYVRLAQVHIDIDDTYTGNGLYALQDVRRTIQSIVQGDHFVAGLQEFDNRVTAYISTSTGY